MSENNVVPLNAAAAENLTVTERDSILNHEISRYVRRGYGVESASNGQAVLSKQDKIGWFWNTVLSFLTCGLWLFVIAYRVMNRKSSRIVLYVDPAGVVQRRN